MAQEQALIKQIEGLLTAYEALFLATRTALEMAEPVDDMESYIHPEVLEELDAAYQKVYRQRQKKGNNHED
jgi:hypothetical protein